MTADLRPRKAASDRIVSVDAFRGLAVLLMLLVNNAAMDIHTPEQFLHAPWNEGVRMADLVFPWFLLCVGVAIPFSMRSARKQELAARELWKRAALRTLALLAIGCVVDSAIQHKLYIGLGVLQLIGLAYFLGFALYLIPRKLGIVVGGLMLLGYGLAIQMLPVPGYGFPIFDEDANLIRHLNLAYLEPFALKGALSAIPTGALVAIGTVVGDFVLMKDSAWKKLGLIALLGGLLTVFGVLWAESLPYNKPVWTSSYILLSSGLGCFMLCALMLLLDILPLKKLAFPLQVFGANALAGYVLPILIKTLFLQTVFVGSVDLQRWLIDSSVRAYGQPTGGWVYTVSYIVVAWVILAVMYWRGWLLRV